MGDDRYVYTVVIAAAAEKVWEGLTAPEFTRQYWHSTRVTSDWQPGSDIVFLVDGEDGDIIGCEGKILTVEYLQELSYTWSFPRNEATRDEPPSRVTFLLESIGEATRLTIVHDQFAENSSMLSQVKDGWPLVICGLKTLLETGEPFDFSMRM